MSSSFKSMLASDIESFISMKRSLGYRYNSEEYILHRFDAYWERVNGTSDSVTMESLSEWVKQGPTEGKSFQYARVHTVKQLMVFRNSIGKPSYIPMDKIKCPRRPAVHVLSSEEIQALFAEIDTYRPYRQSEEVQRISMEYPVLFRLILTTGLRRSEAVSLRIQDFDTDKHTMLIRSAKGHKDRIIRLSSDMSQLLERYLKYMKHLGSEWIFPAVDFHYHLSSAALGDRFNRFWNKTAYAEKCNPKPTIHCMRHTFVVMRINNWIEDGVDTAVMIPYLCRYLGHKSAEETFYYYHQVLDSLEIIRQNDTLSSTVLPEVRVR